MTRIDKARKRLVRAVERLEGARRAQADRLVELKEALKVEPDAGDIGDLVRALDEAQRENTALVAERDAMADRVDAIIGKVRSVAGTNDNERAGSGL